jgi:hypothetical protein
MRILRSAAALLGACAVAGTIGTPVASAQPGCSDLQGVVGQDQMCRVHVQTDTYSIDMSFPNDYPDQQSLVDYLTESRDGFVNVAEDSDAYNLPYELDADGAGYRSNSLLPLGGTRITRRSTGTWPRTRRSRSIRCSSRVPNRST